MKGKTLHSQAREIVRKVMKFCEEEKRNSEVLIPLVQATKRAATMTGTSEQTITRIRRATDELKHESDVLSSPGKHRSRPSYRNINLEEFDKCAIRNVILEFYITKKLKPTIGKLLQILKERINFTWGRTSLSRILYDMGYRWRKCGKVKIMMEQPHIIAERYEFIRDVREFRNSGRFIVYVKETWLDTSVKFLNCWQKNDKAVSKKLYVVHACGKSGFIPHACVIRHIKGVITYVVFEKWIRFKLIPNLPPNSVVCLETAPHHIKKISNIPNKCSTKSVMTEWLRDNNVQFDVSMRKPELFKLVTENAPSDQTRRVEKLLTDFGHDVLRLPPHNSDLNIIPWAWKDLKQYIKVRVAFDDVSLQNLKKLTEEGIESIAKNDFSNYLIDVIKIEESYWEKDAAVENVLDQMVTNIGSSLEESESESSEYDDVDSETEEDDDAMDSDAEEKDSKSLEKPPEIALESEPRLVLGSGSNLLMPTVTPSVMFVQLNPTTIIASEPGPSTQMGPDSSMMELEQDVHSAMTCEVYPAEDSDSQPDILFKIKDEPLDPKIYKQDILSANVIQEVRHFSKEPSVTNNSFGSLFQSPVLIKEEPVSLEEEL